MKRFEEQGLIPVEDSYRMKAQVTEGVPLCLNVPDLRGSSAGAECYAALRGLRQ